jgi:hypothetical protein
MYLRSGSLHHRQFAPGAFTGFCRCGFCLLSNILDDANLFKDVIEEVSGITAMTGNSVSRYITKFQSHCPLIISAWQETLSHISANGAVPTVKTDSLLSNTYILKAGSWREEAEGRIEHGY